MDNEDGSQTKLRGRDVDPELYETLLRMDYEMSDVDEVEATVCDAGRGEGEGRGGEGGRGRGDGEGRGGEGGKRGKEGREVRDESEDSDSEEELSKPRNRLSQYDTMSCGYAADGSIRRLPKSVLRYSRERLRDLLNEMFRPQQCRRRSPMAFKYR